MTDGERRRLVFTNLLNGIPVQGVMVALKMSEAEVMADFRFVAQKVRSYRFERTMFAVACETIAQAREQRVELLFTMVRCNLDVLPKFSKIVDLPYTVGENGRMSEAEQAMMAMRMRAAAQ